MTRLQHEEITLARAKNTERAAARRRARAAARAAEREELEEQPEEAVAAEEPRQPMFTPPRFREDLRALPRMFRERRALWIPVILLVVGFALLYAYASNAVPPDLEGPVLMYVQFFFVPTGLFTFFLGGFLATRASYLVGFLLGLLNGLLWLALIALDRSGVPGSTEGMEPIGTGAIVQLFVYALIYGTLAAAFAGWYRNFLRRMSERGRARRAEREAQERARRRDERRQARRPAG
jgi:hypothetical protein